MKSVVLTGAERGVGKAIARVLLEQGYHLIGVSISMSGLEKMKEEMISELKIPETALDLIEFDLGHVDRVGSLVDAIRNCLRDHTLWGFVNNAATYFPSSGRSSRLLDIEPDDIDEIMNVNLIAAFLLSREMFRIMKEAGRGGSMVLIASVASRKGSVMNPVYAMTKAALANLARCIAAEGGADNIRANAISPGVLETEMGLSIYRTKERLQERMEKNLIKRACKPEEVAHLTAYLLSEQAAYMTGENLDLSGGSLIK
jgi:NAD(P)-dependent dehydrogenase (short-subunit alcohol dehydrogenase family)